MFFLTMIFRSFGRQAKRRLLIALTVCLSATVSVCMLGVVFDVGDKVNAELSTYGSNIVVQPKSQAVVADLYHGVDHSGPRHSLPHNPQAYLQETDLPRMKTIFWSFNIVNFAPKLSVWSTVIGPCGTSQCSQKNVELTGTWFRKQLNLPTGEQAVVGVQGLRSWWKIQGKWAKNPTFIYSDKNARQQFGGRQMHENLASYQSSQEEQAPHVAMAYSTTASSTTASSTTARVVTAGSRSAVDSPHGAAQDDREGAAKSIVEAAVSHTVHEAAEKTAQKTSQQKILPQKNLHRSVVTAKTSHNHYHSSANGEQGMIGQKLAQKLDVHVGDKVTLMGDNGQRHVVTITGIYHSSDNDDYGMYIPLSLSQNIAQLPNAVASVEVKALTTPENELARRAARDPAALSQEDWETWYCTAYPSSIAYQIEEAIPGAIAKQVRQIAAVQGAVLQKTEAVMILMTILSLVAAAIAVANLLSAAIGQRSTELALMKSVGATDGAVCRFMLSEIAMNCLGGAVIGAGLGSLMAQVVGTIVFHSWITMRPMVFVLVFVLLAITIFIASLSSIRSIIRLRPAEVLHGR